MASSGSSPMLVSQVRPLASARAASEKASRAAKRGSAKASRRSFNRPFPARAASTASVVSSAICVARSLIASTQRASRSPSAEVANSSLNATMPVSGVRTSWAKVASADSNAFEGVRFTADFARNAARLPARDGDLTFALERDRDVGFDVDLAIPSPVRPLPRQDAGHVSSEPGHAGQASPIIERMSAGDAPPARSSRSPVARVDFDSLRPSPSRIRR